MAGFIIGWALLLAAFALIQALRSPGIVAWLLARRLRGIIRETNGRRD